MSEESERNRKSAERWMTRCWESNPATDCIIDEQLADESVGPFEGMTTRGKAEFQMVRDGYLAAFPEVKVTVETTVAERDRVAVRWRAKGVHAGDLGGLRATQPPVAMMALLAAFPRRKIVEGHDTVNRGALLAQLSAP